MKARVAWLLREPLVHFLLLGTVLFAVFAVTSKPTETPPGRITVTRGTIEHLATAFSRTWQRPPTAQELRGLIDSHIREEVYYRAALAMKLDRDDTVVRRRLQQKLEYLSEDIAALSEPSDDDLRAFMQANAERFRSEQRFTFTHIYLKPGDRPEGMAEKAALLLATLADKHPGDDLSKFGDRFLLDSRFDAVGAGELAKLFGDGFVARLKELPQGLWAGPIDSGYGLHLVFVEARTDGSPRAFEDIRGTVLREWTDQRRKEARETFYRTLLGSYEISIDDPGGGVQAGPAR